MKYFINWLESRGIRVDDDMDKVIDELSPKVLQAALKSKSTGEIIDLGWVKIRDPYTKRDRDVSIEVINDPTEDHGTYNPIMGVKINVAHTKPEEINLRWTRRLLVHELGVHGVDPKINQFNVFSKLPNYIGGSAGVAHYNQPLEFDAYTGQLVHALLKTAKLVKNNPENKPNTLKLLQDTLTFLRSPKAALEAKVYGIISDPDYWKIFWTYYQYAPPNLKKRMQARVARATMEAIDILNKG